MRLIASLVYCLLALAGCHDRNGTTSITRATSSGQDVIFSKTLATATETNVHCLASSSGHCHYLVYEEHCAARTADAGSAAPVCARKTLDSFALVPGQVRELRGIPRAAHTCVDAKAPSADCHG
ncbi:hypothetical protein [Xanthomonas hortorum]|uniref:Uncharacterized protein n=1 Tax=Xanthomonas hortorum pv. hederae TaxID=453603 RepID=A0A9X4H6G9_9XANT|nr:hypothetical protein [Xanthomonas hortorum]MCE4373269.1 hypothetical protein [Xanthomonas hortorum pv. hederae]MDC8640045.1 hypothetical protein [Xanthomonas hortorum pv. hederae]PPU76907.1 hypothetical protein XhhCFBP4925_19695 [Xanthomonas hortorum pv. hederae]PUE97086.1 hypothetical protein C7T87_20505 [Xanthomonas hortorum pv. hederae]